jgi:hypothetical protein
MSTNKNKPAVAAPKPEKAKRNQKSKKDLALGALDRVIKMLPKLPYASGEVLNGLEGLRTNLSHLEEDKFPRLAGRQKAAWAPGIEVVVKDKAQEKYEGIVPVGAKLKLVSQHDRRWKCQLLSGEVMVIPSAHLRIADK